MSLQNRQYLGMTRRKHLCVVWGRWKWQNYFFLMTNRKLEKSFSFVVRSVSLQKCQNRANCERNLKFCTEFLDVLGFQNSEGSNFFGHSKWLKQPKWLYQPMVNISRWESDISLIFVLNDAEYMVSYRCLI